MIDRIVRGEVALGRFAPPTPTEEAPQRAAEPEQKADLVTTMLANEAARAKQKAEQERQKEREAMISRKKEELRSATTLAELKQRLSKRGAGATGSKEELVEALMSLMVEEDALAERKAE